MNETEIPNVYTAFQTALAADRGWAWGWHCNLAMPIKDTLGVSHIEANQTAAWLMQHLFKIDVTSWPEYTDIVNAKATKEISIRVSGQRYNSGAISTARALAELLKLQGMVVNLGDGLDSGESLPTIPENTVFNVTAKEPIDIKAYLNKLQDNNPGLHKAIWTIADAQLQEAQELVLSAVAEDPNNEDEFIHERGDCDCYCGGHSDSDDACEEEDDPDPDSDAYPGFTTATYVDTREFNNLTLRVNIPETENNPTHVIDGLLELYPSANIDISLNLDDYSCASIKTVHAQKKVLEITVDSADSDAVATREFLLDAISNPWGNTTPQIEPVVIPDVSVKSGSLVKKEPVYLLSDSAERRNAYVFSKTVNGETVYTLARVDIEQDEFSPEQILGEGWSIVSEQKVLFTKLVETLGIESEYIPDIFLNNERWLNLYGDGKVVTKRNHEGPFTIWTISQGDIPKAITNVVESAWTTLLNVDNLPVVAEVLDDSTVVVNKSDYIATTHGMLRSLEHPRQEELFLKLLKHHALENPDLARWLESFGK